jgi:hypothetical protein
MALPRSSAGRCASSELHGADLGLVRQHVMDAESLRLLDWRDMQFAKSQDKSRKHSPARLGKLRGRHGRVQRCVGRRKELRRGSWAGDTPNAALCNPVKLLGLAES